MKTLVLDFGNVLAFFDHRRAVRRLASFTPLSPADLFAVLYNGPLEDAYEAGRITTTEYIAAARRDARLSCTDAEFVDAYGEIFTRNPDVCDLLPALARRYRLVLASNTNPAHFERFAADYADDLRHFAHVGTSFRAGHRKPHPGFFAHLQRFAEAEPGECLFVDDLVANVEAGRRHGWAGLVYGPGAKLADELRAAGVAVN